jgi:hypothetical protein
MTRRDARAYLALFALMATIILAAALLAVSILALAPTWGLL